MREVQYYKNKTGDMIIENLEKIFKEMKPFKKDARLIIGRGTEYLNKIDRKFITSILPERKEK